MLPHDVAMSAEADGGMAAGCRGRWLWRGRGLCPRRGSVDCAAMRSDWDYVGKLALRRKVARDVFVVCGYSAELFAGAFMRIEHDDGLSRSLLEIVKRRNEVGVSRDKYDTVKVIFDVVDEHLGGDVYVRAFFLGFPHCCYGNLLAGLAGFLCERITGAETFIVALNDLQFWAICFKGGEVYGLPHLCGWLRRVIVDASCEVLDGHDFVFIRTWQKGVCESDNIQPLVLRKAE